MANAKEVLGIVNRSGPVHSASDVAAYLDKAILTCIAGGFRSIRMRGDCKFSQSEYLDGWDALVVKFQFGYEARDNLKAIADELQYFPNLTAQSLKTSINNDIILITPSISINSVESIEGIESEADGHVFVNFELALKPQVPVL